MLPNDVFYIRRASTSNIFGAGPSDSPAGLPPAGARASRSSRDSAAAVASLDGSSGGGATAAAGGSAKADYERQLEREIDGLRERCRRAEDAAARSFAAQQESDRARLAAVEELERRDAAGDAGEGRAPDELRAQLSAAQGSIEQLRVDLEAARAKAAEDARVIGELSGELEKLRGEVDQERTAAVKAERRASEAVQAADAAARRVDELETTVAEAEAVAQEALRGLSAARTTAEEANERAGKAEADAEDLRETAQVKSDAAEEARRQQAALHDELSSIARELLKQGQTIKVLQQERDNERDRATQEASARQRADERAAAEHERAEEAVAELQRARDATQAAEGRSGAPTVPAHVGAETDAPPSALTMEETPTPGGGDAVEETSTLEAVAESPLLLPLGLGAAAVAAYLVLSKKGGGSGGRR